MFDQLLQYAPLIATAASALEARSNRRFQERMSSTAYQRSVRDMMAAGINPIMAARTSGASTPSGAEADFSPVSSAGVIKAQVELLQAQAMKTRVEAADIQNTWATGRASILASQADIAKMDAEQKAKLLETAVANAKAEVRQRLSSAAGAEAAAALDQAALAGAKNLEELEKKLGPAGPAVRMLFELMRTLRGAAR